MRLESFLIFGLVFFVKLAVTDANPSSQVDNNFPSYGHTSCSKTCGHIIRTNDIPTFRVSLQLIPVTLKFIMDSPHNTEGDQKVEFQFRTVKRWGGLY
jgi:hypothetical protein